MLNRNYAALSANAPVPFQLGAPVEFWIPSEGEQWREIIRQTAIANDIPPQLIVALIRTESGFNPNAVGPATKYGTAKGLGQFLDSTAKDFGVDQFDPESSIRGIGAYLRYCADYVGTDLADAVAAYNWGIGNMKKYVAERQAGKNPVMPAETMAYVANVYYRSVILGV